MAYGARLSQMSLTNVAIMALLVALSSGCLVASGVDSVYSLVVGRPFSTPAVLLALVVPVCALAFLAIMAVALLYERGRARSIAVLVGIVLVAMGTVAGGYVAVGRVRAAEGRMTARVRELCAGLECSSACAEHARACVYGETGGGASSTACLRARCR